MATVGVKGLIGVVSYCCCRSRSVAQRGRVGVTQLNEPNGQAKFVKKQTLQL